jgi:cytochrome c oxidase subunit 2
MLKILEYVALTVFFAGLIIVSRWAGYQAYTWMPAQATAEAQRVDDLFSFLVAIGTFIFLGLVGMILYSAIFYRAAPNDYSEGHPSRGDARLEVLWTLTPVLLVIWLSLRNAGIYGDLNLLGLKQIVQLPFGAPAEAAIAIATNPPATDTPQPPSNTPKPATEAIDVIAKQWNWLFRYPNQVVSKELHLPVNESTQLNLQAEEVIHGFYIPEFRLRQDAVPGRDIAIVLTPIRAGKYRLQDAEYSGTYFALMQADVYVEPRETYERWLSSASQHASEIVDMAIAEQQHPPKTLFQTGWNPGLPDPAPVADLLRPKDGNS